MAVRKSTNKKKTTAKKKAMAKKSTTAKKAVKKKVSTKKAATAKQRATAKTAPKKKSVTKRKTTAKKAAVKKKSTAAKPAAVKATTKKKATAKKKSTAAKPATVKATTAKSASKKRATAKKLVSQEPQVATALPIEGIDPYSPSSGEIYMSDEQYDHFRNILIEWKRQLMEEVDRTVDHMKTDAANYADPADRATQEEEFSLELRTRDRERKLIKKIDESLALIDSGEYGFCEGCGIEIGIRRLEARPTATLCIDCKTLQEIKEKQIYS
jgi:DnaK suppressor protein